MTMPDERTYVSLELRAALEEATRSLAGALGMALPKEFSLYQARLVMANAAPRVAALKARDRRAVVIVRDRQVEQVYLMDQEVKPDPRVKEDLDAIDSAARSRGFSAEFRVLMHSRPMTANEIMERVRHDCDRVLEGEDEP